MTHRRRNRTGLFLGMAFLAINGFFVAKVPDATRPELAGISAMFVLVLAFPAFFGLWKWQGPKVCGLVLLALGAFAVGIESFALKTGWPYGSFVYGDQIGVKYFGLVPWTVPFAWSPLVLGAYYMAAGKTPPPTKKEAKKKKGVPVARESEARFLWRCALWLVAFDLVLDPGAVHQKFWTFASPGLYYGVPLSNYLGWIVSGLAGGWILVRLLKQAPHAPPPGALAVSTLLILSFWSSVCLFSELWLPALIGSGLLVKLCGRVLASDSPCAVT